MQKGSDRFDWSVYYGGVEAMERFKAALLEERQRIEPERHRCEVRAVLRMRVQHGVERARTYIERVRKARGDAAADRLRADANEQWRLGNRGESGDWR